MSNRAAAQKGESLQTTAPPLSGVLQRKCDSCGQHTVAGGGCSDCEKKKGMLQRRASSSETTSEVPPIVHDVLRSPGHPLDASTRAFMEPRFGHDFSQVRVHADNQAAESAQAVNALAYTVGKNVVFGAGQYAPETSAGRRLMVHELVHVVQQGNVVEQREDRLSVGETQDRAEQQADKAVRAFAELQPMSIRQHLPAKIARQELGDDSQPPSPAGPIGAGRPVFFCSKPILGTSLHRQSHAFFRVGGSGPGNPTFELEHEKPCPCAWQGVPKRDYPEDFNAADAPCIPAPSITEDCLLRNWSTYPVGQYCGRGPNSNTYARVIAERCGATGLRPPGGVMGFDSAPPVAGTYGAPHPYISAGTGWCAVVECGEFCPSS